MWKMIKRRKWLFSGILTLTILLSVLSLQVKVIPETGNQTIGQGHLIITIGDSTYASGTVDYVCDGTDDDIQFQGALDALPATGGELQVLTGSYDFANATTVTRAIPNVKITGTGQGSSFTCDGATAIFTAGGNGWTISNIKTDAGGLAMGVTTLWSWENVTINATYYAYRTDDATSANAWNIPTGRSNTYVIAAFDAPDRVKSQADVVCDGTSDNVEIQSAINNASSILLIGDFVISSTLVFDADSIDFSGGGRGVAQISLANGSNCDMVSFSAEAWNTKIEKITFNGNKANQASGRGLNLTKFHGTIQDVLIGYCKQDGIYVNGAADSDLVKFYNVESQYNDGHGFNLISVYGYTGVGILSSHNTGDGFHFVGGGEYFLSNISSDLNTGIGWYMSNVVRSNFNNFWVGDCGSNAIQMVASCIDDTLSNGMVYHPNSTDADATSIYLNVVQYCNFTNITIVADTPNATGYNIVASINNNFIGGSIDCLSYGIIINDAGNYNNIVNSLTITTVGATPIALGSGSSNTVINVKGFINSGEIRTASGTLTAGNANAITFAWHNPELQDIFITKVVIEITTVGGTALSVIQVGLANDAAGTGLGSELFSGIDANATAINDSWIAGDTGTQTKLFVCQDNLSAADDWVVGKILTQNAAALVGKYYIFYVGR